MLSNDEVRKALGENFSHLSEAEVEQIKLEMYYFCKTMIGD